MAFQVILATAPTEQLGNVRLSLEFSTQTGFLGQTNFTFGAPSSIEGKVLDLIGGPLTPRLLTDFSAELTDKSAVSVNVHAGIHTSGGTVNFTLDNLSSNDTLHVLALSRRLFLGNVFHGAAATIGQKQCVARCADGKAGQVCVTCTQGVITVKICC